MAIITYKELETLVKEKKVKNVEAWGEKHRLFYNSDGVLGRFRKGSSRRGYMVECAFVDAITKISYHKEKGEVNVDKKVFNQVKKFRVQAEKASFSNDFIADCLKCPKDFDTWVAEGKKDAYNYNVTTGCKITGNLVSVDTILKKISRWEREEFVSALKNKIAWRSSRFDYNGYDGSVSFEVSIYGQFKGYLSKEFRNCGNGYYYLLVNDENFIGYDVD